MRTLCLDTACQCSHLIVDELLLTLAAPCGGLCHLAVRRLTRFRGLSPHDKLVQTRSTSIAGTTQTLAFARVVVFRDPEQV